MYDFSSYLAVQSELSDRIFAALNDALGEDGPVAVILGSKGNWRCSDSARFQGCFAGGGELRRLTSMIDDGWDPVGVCIGGCFVIGVQIDRLWGDCEYMFIVVPGYNHDSAQANMGLIEAVLNQALCIVGFVEASVQSAQSVGKDLTTGAGNSALAV